MAGRRRDVGSGGRARRLVGVAKVLVPAAAPVVLPIAAGAAARVRELYDQARARRMGVPVDRLPEFTGHGAALHARVANALDSVDELGRRSGASDGDRFVAEARTRCGQLLAAVRAAERMPAPRRRAAHRAIDRELAVVETELLHRLDVHP
ncbi:hypothetical protein C1701_10700 [Actinoalloteichus sp. AHMU CJ021]|uniref:Uncharacterized protein n=2 Tax=Actinoalloteichus cyanogriseus TaxID=2893586 RepID=A0ABT1JK79_ACTCY|nr:DUF6474 family protein [Actinoalloteichus caeruleus]AUS81642.1 hypothetical protein C1701_10700 [Actinoalloteichus sp. AHMU CJ021]MCP2332919.1 hypothetical protein [Actinoalloteichus caeruleus DSM 43889]